MSDRRDAGQERRRYQRIAPKGTVMLRAGEGVQHGRIANLGEGGVLVAATVGAPARSPGQQVHLELRLDRPDAEWLPCRGQITRTTADGFAVAFEDISASLRREIAEIASSSRAHGRVMNIVLVDADPARRATMATAFRAAGCTVIEASTSLEAIVRLGESSFEPALIAIADSLPAAIADELRAFVDREHPDAKLVTIGHDIVGRADSTNWLSSGSPDDLLARVREMLGRPRRPTGS